MRKAARDFMRVDVHVEQPRKRDGEFIGVAVHIALYGRDQAMLACVRPHFDDADIAAPFDRATVNASFHRFNACRRSPADECDEPCPVERALVR
ncbi:hypothetical protein GCM10010985_33900 [Caballeronia grimmiae]|uniref:Uncharacterized protein n=1 Tax=Caballeronia grimmiae TaxID=1071679 RepID=A0ABQ1RP88_9BURK|nr:hypothetical protein GCM10010985_33900 [Caballeronia grimmiae]